MTNSSQEQMILPSLLDRLTNEESTKIDGLTTSTHKQILQLRESIRRDLENLLNTRRPQFVWSKNLSGLNNSLFAYGIPSIIGTSLTDIEGQKIVCQQIKEAIQLFEKRIKEVKIILIEGDNNANRLRLRIEGILIMEAAAETIAFDTFIEPEKNNAFIINSAGN